jgi:hypothetical protein
MILEAEPTMRRILAFPTLVITLTACSLEAVSSSARAERMSFLDNGNIKIGVDLHIGGTITFLARSQAGENLINSHDLGRQIQQSYYSGPSPFGKPHPAWKNWGWNPIGSGDVYGHGARVLEHRNDGTTLYVKTIPMQWALNNVPGECTFETWITLDGHTARVRNKLVNQRPDQTQYPAQGQELPAVYTIGKLHRLFSYTGDRPFENQPLAQIRNAGPPWANWKATENWAALVNDQGFGVGVIHPGVYSFIGGFYGKPNTGGPKNDSTGYIAPTRQEILDHNIVYEYRYQLVLGSLEEIRAQALSERTRDTRPGFHFTHDRQHWIYHEAHDAGFPPERGLRIKLSTKPAALISPEQWWRAEDVPTLHIRAATKTHRRPLAILWTTPAADFAPDKRVEFAIQPDGKMHDYEIHLAESPRYRGTITRLRLDVGPADSAEDELMIESISWKSATRKQGG